jgi:hypothetical protein
LSLNSATALIITYQVPTFEDTAAIDNLTHPSRSG